MGVGCDVACLKQYMPTNVNPLLCMDVRKLNCLHAEKFEFKMAVFSLGPRKIGRPTYL